MTGRITRSQSSAMKHAQAGEASDACPAPVPPPAISGGASASQASVAAGRAAARRLRKAMRAPADKRRAPVPVASSSAPPAASASARRTPATRGAAIRVTHPQVYHRALDDRFPIRHPGDPTRIHPSYADPSDPTRCAPAVTIKGATFSAPAKARLLKHARKDREFKLARFGNREAYLDALGQSVVRQIEASIIGKTPPGLGRLKVVRLTREQCETGQEADGLEGQCGVVLEDYSPGAQPTLQNGEIVGVFGGSKLDSDEARAQYVALFGEELGEQIVDTHSIPDAGRGRVTWAAYGGGNALQFLNTALRLSRAGDWRVDARRVHGDIELVDITLTDKDGQERQEEVALVVQYRPVADGKQFLLSYGPHYRQSPDEADAAPEGAGSASTVAAAAGDGAAPAPRMAAADDVMEDAIVVAPPAGPSS